MIYVGILLVTIVIWLFYEWIEHTMTEYNSTTVECHKNINQKPVKVCIISDLHNNKKNLQVICEKLNRFAPDLILIPGDMVNKHSKTQKNAIAFLNQISGIAPVYYSLGNHEEYLRCKMPLAWESYKNSLSEEIYLLDNSSVTAQLPNGSITVSGLSLPEKFYGKGKLKGEKDNLPELEPSPQQFHILLAHHPEYAAWYEKYHPDFVCSGHLHGGLLRLPVLGGMVSPRLRIPKEDAGVYLYPYGTLFISRGLGSHTVPLRFFNRTEINFVALDMRN